jgi:hypothetical protein
MKNERSHADIYSSKTNKQNHIDLLTFFLALNMPLSLIADPVCKKFAAAHGDFPMASSSSYRNTILPDLYYSKFKKSY